MEQGWFCNPRRIQGKVLKLSGAADYRAQKRFASKQTASGDENACFDGRMQRYTKMVLPYTIVVALIQKKIEYPYRSPARHAVSRRSQKGILMWRRRWIFWGEAADLLRVSLR